VNVAAQFPALHLALANRVLAGCAQRVVVAKQRTLYVAVPVQQSAPAEIRVYTVK
jgi:hypothetical protein